MRHALAEAGSLTAHVTNGSHDVLLGFSYTISCLDLEDQEAIGDRSPQATMTPYLISPQITKSTGEICVSGGTHVPEGGTMLKVSHFAALSG